MNLAASESHFIWHNYPLICSLLSWGMAQILKTLISYKHTKRFDLERLFGAGGMPSAHSAMVSSLTIAISKNCGINSPIFAISAILAMVVMYDSTGVRRSSGEQAKLLNRMVEVLDIPEIKQYEIKKKLKIFNRNSDDIKELNHDMKMLKEKLGHTPLEVMGGALLGIIIALVVPK